MTKNVASKSFALTTGSDGRRYSDPARATAIVLNISRGATVTTTSGTAANVSSADYSAPCRSSGFPQVIEWDLSSLVSTQRDDVLLIWRAHDNYNLFDAVPYNCVGDYKIQAWNGSAWTDLITVTGNTYSGRPHRISNMVASSYTKLRMNCDVGYGSTGNTDFETKIDIYSIKGFDSVRGCIHVGDSLTSNAFALKPNFGLSDTSFGEQVKAINGKYTPELMWGQSGTNTTRWTTAMTEYNALLDSSPLDTVWICYGTNQETSADTFQTNLTTLVTAAQDKGKRVVIDYLVGNTATTHATAYNAKIDAVIASTGCLFGVDLKSYFAAHTSELDADGIHLTPAGSVSFRSLRAARFAALG